MTTEARQTPLPAGVSAVVEQMRERLRRAALEDVFARYDVGTVLHSFRYDLTADAESVTMAALAASIGVDVSALRRCARVTETIGREEFSALMALRNGRGLPLTWSHLEVLSTERNAKERSALAVIAISEALSVRALTALIRRRRQSPDRRRCD